MSDASPGWVRRASELLQVGHGSLARQLQDQYLSTAHVGDQEWKEQLRHVLGIHFTRQLRRQDDTTSL